MDGSLLPPTLYTVKGILILDNNGKRIWAKYYDPAVVPTLKEQEKFEASLFSKTSKANAEILMLDGLTVLYKSSIDLYFYVLGGLRENELLLLSVLYCVYDSISLILRKNVEKAVVFENLDVIMLALDEIVDGGIVLESDATAVLNRVALKTEDIPIGEQTVAQVIQSAKEQLRWSLLK